MYNAANLVERERAPVIGLKPVRLELQTSGSII